MQLSTLDWSFIAAFFVLSLVIGLVASKRAGQSASEYFLSGRSMPWWLLSFSMVATTFSADTPNLVLPAFLVNPARVNGPGDLASKCKGFGLSLFQEKNGAKSHFLEWMEKTRGKFANLVGDHLATLTLESEDGIGSEPETANFMHFTFHEYENADLTKKVSQIEKI